MIFNDMFKSDVEKKSEQADKLAAENIRLTGDIARTCLSLSQFKSYRTQYAAAEENMVQAMLMLTESFNAGRVALTEYGSKMLVYMTRLKDLRMLLDVVTLNSKKGIEEK